MEKIKIRLAVPEDHNFILTSWMKSYLDHGNWIFKPTGKVYFAEAQERIKRHLKGTVLIATTEADENQILGYVVLDATTVHYCYVKNTFRGFKIARALMKKTQGCEFYSQHTTYSKHITKGLTHNPYKF